MKGPGRNLILYKYYPPDRVDVLEQQRVHFSHPDRFNDPFELEPHIEQGRLPDDAKELGSLAEAMSKKLGREVSVEGIKAISKSPEMRKNVVTEWKRNRLVFSMSEDCDSLLMWAHYGAAHTGFVIGFDLSKDAFALRADGRSRDLAPVRYGTHRPTARIIEELREEEILLTKSVDWMHEREWRMFESPFNADDDEDQAHPGCWPFYIQAEVIERVVLGARISQATEHRIAALLQEPRYLHVRLLRCSVAEDQFRVRMSLVRPSMPANRPTQSVSDKQT